MPADNNLISQSNDINRISEFYAQDFEETIRFAEANKDPIEIHMNYEDLVHQAVLQKQNYRDTKIDIKKNAAADNHISVNFYSTSIDKKMGEVKHRLVCGIGRVWAVVTPYHFHEGS